MKKLIYILLLICCSSPVFAQKYSTTAGVRISRDNYGFTVKQRVFKSYALEGIIAGSSNEILGTLLLEKHFPLVGKGLNFYIGGGAHMGAIKDFGSTVGADALVGAELKVPFLPLVVSADVKPAYHVVHEDWFDFNAGVSVRYIIGKDTKKQRERHREQRKKRRLREKVRKERVKARQERKEERLKAKIRKLKGKDDQEDKKLFEDIHLLQIFKKKDQPEKDKQKRK